jgi:hypothetical protein
MYQGAFTIMCKALEWKRFRISVRSESCTTQLYSIGPNWFEYYLIYGKFVAVETFDLHPSS